MERASDIAIKEVFVLYPRGKRSGGPEALHQLVDSMRRQDIEAYLVPYPETRNIPRVDEYSIYNAPEVAAVRVSQYSAVVGGESQAQRLARLPQVQKYLWWLAIESAPTYRGDRRRSLTPYERPQHALLRSLKDSLLRADSARRRISLDLSSFSHLTQSQYAWSYLATRHLLAPTMLSDYTSGLDLLRESAQPTRSGVSYNAVKAGYLTEQVAEMLPTVEFIPLKGMSPEQVRQALGHSLIYLDLGPHPGKDRLPREAAIAGNIVSVALRGAGAFSDDVPIPTAHKVVAGPDIVVNAAQLISDLMSRPSTALDAQARYRQDVFDERHRFDREVTAIFRDRQTGFDTFAARSL